MELQYRTVINCILVALSAITFSQAICPAGYLGYKRKSCFRFRYYEDEAKTRDFAKSDCYANNKGLLASIDDAEQEQFLTDNFLYDKDARYTVWLGLIRNPRNRDQFIWEDGNNATYRHWEPGEPNMFEGKQEFCVHFDVKTVAGVRHNGWNDEPCDSDQTFGFLCRLPFDTIKLNDAAQAVKTSPDLATTTGWAIGGSIGAAVILIMLILFAYFGYRRWSDKTSTIPMVQLHNEPV